MVGTLPAHLLLLMYPLPRASRVSCSVLPCTVIPNDVYIQKFRNAFRDEFTGCGQEDHARLDDYVKSVRGRCGAEMAASDWPCHVCGGSLSVPSATSRIATGCATINDHGPWLGRLTALDFRILRNIRRRILLWFCREEVDIELSTHVAAHAAQSPVATPPSEL